MSYPYSSQSHTTADAVTTSFSYSDVPLLADVPHKDQLRVYENGQLRTFNVTGADNYALNTTSELVIFNSPRASGVTIKIARSTDIENKEVTFTNSSVLTAQDLNKNSDQLLFLCQELYDKAQDISLTATGGIPPNSIGSSQLISDAGDEAVTSSVIRDGAVTEAKLGSGAVTEAKLGSGAVTEAKLGALSVTGAKIANTTITPNKLATSLFEYKEWTPELKLMNSAGTLKTTTFTPHQFYGVAIKLNRLVICVGRVGWSAYSIGDGNATTDYMIVQNLPYATDSTLLNGANRHGGASIIYQSGWVDNVAPRYGLIYTSGAYANRMIMFKSGNIELRLNDATGSIPNFIFSCIYPTPE